MNNKMEQIAELLGVELYEEFYIRHSGTREKYRFTEKGLEYHYIEGWGWANSYLIEIFTGEFEIIKTPWKPKYNEGYWYLDTNGYVIHDDWIDCNIDFIRLRMGNVFKNQKNAEANSERFIKYIKEEPDYSWRAENNE